MDTLKSLIIKITTRSYYENVQLGVSRISLSRILNGKTAITPEMATRIGLALNNSPSMWLGMQADYDLWQIEQNQTFHITPIYT